MNTLAEFEAREAEILPSVADTLKALGERAIFAYASVGLYHNTLSHLVPGILREGLRADSPEAVPDLTDEEFATQLFYAKGYRYPASERQFDILIRGKRQDREPGVFFYPLREPAEEYRVGYGVPERLHVLAMEMACVMLQKEGPYTPAERDRARQIFTKYRDFIDGAGNSHVSVIRANPFNPNIINHRLQDLPEIAENNDKEEVIRHLRVLGFNFFEGVYIPGPITAADLEDTGARLPILTSLDERTLSPSQSRFFYTPAHLQRFP
jgi:hypothetical protein